MRIRRHGSQARLITAAVDSLAELLNQEFLRFDGDTAAVIKAYAQDHRHTG